MPARIIVSLSPADAEGPIPPPHTGPAVYAALLSALHATAGGRPLAVAIHDTRPKPISLTPLLDEHDRRASSRSAKVRFEVGVLVDKLIDPIVQALCSMELRIANCRYRSNNCLIVDACSAEQISSEASRNATAWSLHLITPVTLETGRQDGRRQLRTMPEPRWTLRGLMRRWTATVPQVPLPEELNTIVDEYVIITKSSLRRAQHLILPADPGLHRPQIMWRGSIGLVTYGLLNAGAASDYACVSLDMLIRFAAYAGLGARTNVGMGHVRLLEPPFSA